MEKVLLKDLSDKIHKRAALIPIDGLSEIMDLNDHFSGDELLFELFTKSLRNFEYYHPLVTEMKINTACMDHCERQGYYKIRDNFKLYLQGRITEDQIVLVPNSINGVRVVNSFASPGNYFNPNYYERPYIQMAWASEGDWIIRGIFSRPIIPGYNPDKSFNDDAAIYFFQIEEGVLAAKFLDQVLCDVLEYVRNLKANFRLPNFPVEIFDAADVAYQQIKQELDQYYLQSNWRGELVM